MHYACSKERVGEWCHNALIFKTLRRIMHEDSVIPSPGPTAPGDARYGVSCLCATEDFALPPCCHWQDHILQDCTAVKMPRGNVFQKQRWRVRFYGACFYARGCHSRESVSSSPRILKLLFRLNVTMNLLYVPGVKLDCFLFVSDIIFTCTCNDLCFV